MLRRALETIHWKPVLAVFLLAIGLRVWLSSGQRVASSEAEEFLAVEEEVVEEAEAPAVPLLTFDRDPVEIKPRPEDEQVESTFTFTNTSGKPVTITNLESTCSCLEASLDKATYAPGEKGTGKAVFKVTSFVGRHEKFLHLHTDDPASPEQILTFILDVPVVVSIEPNLLEWTIGETPAPKELVIKMLSTDPMRITKVTPTRENVRYELKEVTPGREYRLIVTPVSTADITVGFFKIETDSKIPKYARQMAFFSIVRPELAEKKANAKSD